MLDDESALNNNLCIILYFSCKCISYIKIFKNFRRVLPTVEPGYMKPLLPSEAPQSPEEWKDIMADIERVIMPGVSDFKCLRRS